MSAQKDKHHPKQLFSINNEGIPWEEASRAKHSRDLLTKWASHYRHLNTVWILMWVSVVAFFLNIGLCFGIAYAGLHVAPVVELITGVLFLVSLILALGFVSFVVFQDLGRGRTYCAKLVADGEGYWDPIDPDLDYMNLSVPTIIQDEGEKFLCVAPQFLWASIRDTRKTYHHPNCYGDFNYFYKMPLPHEVKFYNSERQDEFMRSKHDTQVRLLVAKIVYAKQQISWLERLALEKSSDLVVDEQGELVSVLLGDYKECKNWYEHYLTENVRMFNELVERKLADRAYNEKQKNVRENIVRETLSITR